MASLLALPTELIQMIFDDCDLTTIKHLRLTNSECYDQAADTFYAKSRLIAKATEDGIAALEMITARRGADKVKALTLREPGLWNYQVNGKVVDVHLRFFEPDSFEVQLHKQALARLTPSDELRLRFVRCLERLTKVQEVRNTSRPVSVNLETMKVDVVTRYKIGFGSCEQSFCNICRRLHTICRSWPVIQILWDTSSRLQTNLSTITVLDIKIEDQYFLDFGKTYTQLARSISACAKLESLTLRLGRLTSFDPHWIGQLFECMLERPLANLRILKLSDRSCHSVYFESMLRALAKYVSAVRHSLAHFQFDVDDASYGHNLISLFESLLEVDGIGAVQIGHRNWPSVAETGRVRIWNRLLFLLSDTLKVWGPEKVDGWRARRGLLK